MFDACWDEVQLFQAECWSVMGWVGWNDSNRQGLGIESESEARQSYFQYAQGNVKQDR